MAEQRPFDAGDPNEPVVLTTAANAFEAGIIVATLEEAGIQAKAFDAVPTTLPMSSTLFRVPVLVQQSELEAARSVLAEQQATAPSIDWDSVDVGDDDETAAKASRIRPIRGLWGVVALVVVICVIIYALRALNIVQG